MFLLHLTHDTKFFYEIDIDVTCAKYDRAFYQKTTLSFEKKHCAHIFNLNPLFWRVSHGPVQLGLMIITGVINDNKGSYNNKKLFK